MLEPGLTITGLKLLNVHDGDTLELSVERKFRVRVRGVDCPEINTEEGKKAKEFVETLFMLNPNEKITLFIPSNKTGELMDFYSFNRIVADLYLGETNLCKLLKEHGFEK
jgi:endonuclease YncB( thermonuclease family)